jgi:hypothetical protein
MTTYLVQDAVLRKVGDERLLVPIKGSLADMQCLFSLNDSSEFIWEHLQAGQPLDTIVHNMIEHYGIPYDRAQSDCEHFIQRLLAEGLLLEAGENAT